MRIHVKTKFSSILELRSELGTEVFGKAQSLQPMLDIRVKDESLLQGFP
jgi:hypothetical protein